MKKYFIVLIIALIYSNSANAIDCPASNVEHIQIENNGVLVYLKGQNWHLVGMHDAMGTKEKLSVLLSAQMAGKKVTLRYPDGYNCTAYELNTPTLMVRTHN
jgi:hypothetical protein